MSMRGQGEQVEGAAEILYGQTEPRCSMIHQFSQSDGDALLAKLLRPEEELPKVFKSLDGASTSLHSFLDDTPFGRHWSGGIPDEFQAVPVSWTTATYDMIAMKDRHRSMTGQPTNAYVDDTEFFALKEMASLSGYRGFSIIGATETADEDGFLAPMAVPVSKTSELFIMRFAIVDQEQFADGSLEALGIGRAW